LLGKKFDFSHSYYQASQTWQTDTAEVKNKNFILTQMFPSQMLHNL